MQESYNFKFPQVPEKPTEKPEGLSDKKRLILEESKDFHPKEEIDEKIEEIIKSDEEGAYSEDSIKRVNKMIQFEKENPGKRKPWKDTFETIDDFNLYYKLHTKWQGKSTEDMTTNKEIEGYGFYMALWAFAKKESNNDKEKQKELMQQVFKAKNKDWSTFTSIEDFIDEYKKRPEWQGKSTKEMQKDNKTGGLAFYRALYKFSQKIFNGDKEKQKEKRRDLIQKVFKPKKINRLKYDLNDFIKEYSEHPEWIGKSTEEMGKNKDLKGTGFYQSLWVFAKKVSGGDLRKQKELIQKVIEAKQKDWSKFANIEDFIKEYNNHPEWHGKSTNEMSIKEIESGGSKFYKALNNFAQKTSNGNEGERKAIIRAVFPERKAPFKYNFTEKEVYFDSYPERIIGLLLNKYGLVKEFSEGENLHVLTADGKRNSIDFLVGNNFIEYHPLSLYEAQKGMTLKESGERKKHNIIKLKYQNYSFHHIWEIDQLYDALKDKDIQLLLKEEYRNITKEEFKNHISEAYKLAIKYDAKDFS